MADIFAFIAGIPWWVWVLGFVWYCWKVYYDASRPTMTELERLELAAKNREDLNNGL